MGWASPSMPSRLAQKGQLGHTGQRSGGWSEVAMSEQGRRGQTLHWPSSLCLYPSFSSITETIDLQGHAGDSRLDPVFTLCRGMSFGVRQIWVQIPVLTPKTPAALVQLLASLHFGFRIYKMEGKEHLFAGRQEADRKETVESAWQRQIQGLLRNVIISRGQTNSHTLPVYCKLTPRSWGLFLFLCLVKQHPYSSLEDNPSLPILWGALAPTQAVIINLGKGWGHSSEGSSRVACFGILPAHFRGFSPTCCKRRG